MTWGPTLARCTANWNLTNVTCVPQSSRETQVGGLIEELIWTAKILIVLSAWESSKTKPARRIAWKDTIQELSTLAPLITVSQFCKLKMGDRCTWRSTLKAGVLLAQFAQEHCQADQTWTAIWRMFTEILRRILGALFVVWKGPHDISWRPTWRYTVGRFSPAHLRDANLSQTLNMD